MATIEQQENVIKVAEQEEKSVAKTKESPIKLAYISETATIEQQENVIKVAEPEEKSVVEAPEAKESPVKLAKRKSEGLEDTAESSSESGAKKTKMDDAEKDTDTSSGAVDGKEADSSTHEVEVNAEPESMNKEGETKPASKNEEATPNAPAEN